MPIPHCLHVDVVFAFSLAAGEDFKRACGEAPGEITAVGIMTDTDNAGENAHAYCGDVLFQRGPQPRASPAID